MLHLSARAMAKMIHDRAISSEELITAHLQQIEKINPSINAAVQVLAETALQQAEAADRAIAQGEPVGPLHGVPFSIKDSIDVAGTKCTAGTLGRKDAAPATRDATLVARLRAAGAIPIAKTNLPDLLFSFEADNLIYGRTNNPYDLSRTSGGSSGGEGALIAACGSPLGLGSDSAGSVRVPAAFCGIASIKPTSGRLPRTGHVPPAGLWIEALWQIGPMSRRVEDLTLAMQLLASADSEDLASPPVPLFEPPAHQLRVAFFTNNGVSPCTPEVEDAVRRAADFLAHSGCIVEEACPSVLAQAYELELAILGADGAEGIDAYLTAHGSLQVHPLLTGFVDHMRPYRATAAEFAKRWLQWDAYRAAVAQFFTEYDVILCPVYTQPALAHLDSLIESNFQGFSYTMAWNVAGTPAATVRCGSAGNLPVNVQVVTARWNDMLALHVCQLLENQFGGWQPAPNFYH